MKDLPTISIVIPCWNAEKWIARAIQSTLDQDYPHKEVIVIDDGSTDGSLDIIKSFGDKIRWETGPNRDACAARNRGLALAGGDYVLFPDADDYLEGQVLIGFLEALRCGSYDLVFGRSISENSDGIRSKPIYYESGLRNSDYIKHWLNHKCVQTGALLWRKGFIEGIGGWNESVPQDQEVELVLRALIYGAKVANSRSGWSVWCHHESENRICKRRTKAVLLSRIEFRIRLGREVKRIMPSVASVFAIDLYRFARYCFVLGYDDMARSALAESRNLGFRGHIGSTIRRVTATAFGLELTERIARTKRNMLRIAGGKI